MNKHIGKLLIFAGAMKLTVWTFAMPFFISIMIDRFGYVPTFPMTLLFFFSPIVSLIMIYYGSKIIDEG
jgi:hypothetical protein